MYSEPDRKTFDDLDFEDPVNILMVDDQPAKLLSYEVILNDLGENLIRAGSAREALEQMLRTNVAVVLLDVSMPELDGFELAAMIRQHPRFETTAIIFISAVLQTDLDRIKGYESGAVDYLPVPIVPEIMRAKVRVFVDLYRKTRQLERVNAELEARVASRTAELEASTTRLLESELMLQRLLGQEQLARSEAESARAEALAASRAKDEFLALVSHELRTPLNAILGWARMLQSDTLDEPTSKRAVEVIDRNARSQAQLVEDLLDFSRIVSGRLRLEMRETRLSSVVDAAIEVVRPAAEAKHVRVAVTADVPSDDVVVGDAERLKQVFWNLLSNAVKFTPPNGTIEIRSTHDDDDLVLIVRDTGQGIPVDFLPHVFDQFRQADPSTTRRHGGLGLGLSIVHRLVELHGGEITALSSGTGLGATFTVRLPRTGRPTGPIELSTGTALAPDAAVEDVDLTGVRALVVDDDDDSRETVSVILSRFGADVEAATNVGEAMQAIRRSQPVVLISDIGMPEEDGFVLIGRVRALSDNDGGAIPALALTAYARLEDRSRVLDAGFQMHVTKPVDPNVLVSAVARLAGRFGARRRTT